MSQAEDLMSDKAARERLPDRRASENFSFEPDGIRPTRLLGDTLTDDRARFSFRRTRQAARPMLPPEMRP